MDQIWQNAARKTRERAKRATTKPPTATMKPPTAITKPPTATTTTTSHGTPTPSAKITELRGLVAWQTAKTAWQRDYGQSGQHHVFEDWRTKQSVIERATEDAIAANRSIREHDKKLLKRNKVRSIPT